MDEKLDGVLIWSAAARYSATPLWLVIESIGKESGVAEYFAAALQIKTPPKTQGLVSIALERLILKEQSRRRNRSYLQSEEI